MSGLAHISDDQRRARLGVRHHLARRARTVEAATESVVGLHSSDPVTPYLSAWARVEGFEVADLEAALYESRTLVRMLGMRRTMFVVPHDLASLVDSACTQALAPGQRKRTLGLLADQGISDPEAWLAGVEAATIAALDDMGEATASQLTKVVPGLDLKYTYGEGKTWGATQGISTRVLFLLACAGRIVRVRPLGSWLSSQYRWSTMEHWLGAPFDLIPEADARAALVRLWLGRFGPAGLEDVKWWTGWNLGQTRAALAAAEAVEITMDSGPGYVNDDDLEPVAPPEPGAALLPSLDPTVMGWRQRGWYLGELGPELFDRNGNAGPTIWLDGRIVGGWVQRSDGEIALGVLADVGRDGRSLIEAEAARLTAWMGDFRVTPRFRTPLEQALSSP